MIGVTITPSQIDYSKIITPDVVDEIITGECVILTGFAKELSPVKLGQLKNSIMWKTQRGEGEFNKGGSKAAPSEAKLQSNPSTLEGYVGSNLEYAGAVEDGRKDMSKYPRQPYLRPAIDYSKKVRETRRSGIIKTAIKEAYK